MGWPRLKRFEPQMDAYERRWKMGLETGIRAWARLDLVGAGAEGLGWGLCFFTRPEWPVDSGSKTPLPLFVNDDPIFWQSGDGAAVSDGIESSVWRNLEGGIAEVDPDESGGSADGFGGATGEPTGGVEGEMGGLAFDPDQ